MFKGDEDENDEDCVCMCSSACTHQSLPDLHRPDNKTSPASLILCCLNPNLLLVPNAHTSVSECVNRTVGRMQMKSLVVCRKL